MTQIIPSNTFIVSNFVVSKNLGQGSYTTIQSAVDDASSGDIIFLADGTYNETVILKAGITITAFSGSGYQNAVVVTGGFVFSGGGSVTISNIKIKSDTNPIYSLDFSGNGSDAVNLIGCFIESTNYNSIFYSNTSANSSLNLYNCIVYMTNNSFSFLASASNGTVSLIGTDILNNVNYNTILISNGNLLVKNCMIQNSFSIDSASANFFDSSISSLSTVLSAVSGSQVAFFNCEVYANTNSLVGSAFDGDNSAIINFFNTGISAPVSPTFSNSVRVEYSSLYNLNANPISFSTSAVTYVPILLGDSTVSSLSISSGISTAPANSQSSSLSLGAAYQNTLGYDVVLTVYLEVSAATTATILLGVGSTNSPTQQTIVSSLTLHGSALNVIPVTIYLPDNYYALLSTSGTITASISGQQVMPV